MYSFFMDGVRLPVTPSTLEVATKNQNQTVNLINESEINILKTPGLSEVTIEVLIPAVKYPFAVYPNGFKEPPFFLSLFERLKSAKKPFQFIVSRMMNGRTLFDTNMKVSLEEYTVSEDAESGTDLVVSLNMKQYRDYAVKTVTITNSNTASKPSNGRSTDSAPKQRTYTVVRGDCLWNIAKRYLGNGARYTEIFSLNKDKIKNPSLIYPGQVLTLPAA